MKEEALNLLSKFRKEWFPARDVPTIEDFITWIEKRGYEIGEVKRGQMKQSG